MSWVAFRQCRTELLLATAAWVVLAIYLVPTGLQKRETFEDSGLAACVDAGSDCGDLSNRFIASYDATNAVVGWFNLVPGVVGLLMAAPIVIEFERRTYRLAWTQSITRGRWFAAKLAMALLGVTAFSAALTALMTWWHAPLDRMDMRFGQSFNFEGIVPFAYTLFALALALAAGAVTRRTAPAMLGALVVFAIVRLSVELTLRPGGSGPVGYVESLNDQFWKYQAIEGALFIGSAVVLMALTAWLVRRMS